MLYYKYDKFFLKQEKYFLRYYITGVFENLVYQNRYFKKRKKRIYFKKYTRRKEKSYIKE